MIATIISITQLSNNYHPAVGYNNTVVTDKGTFELDDDSILGMVGSEVCDKLFSKVEEGERLSMQEFVGHNINTEGYNLEFVNVVTE